MFLSNNTRYFFLDTQLFWDRLTYAIGNKGTKSSHKPHFIDKSLLSTTITSASNSSENVAENKIDSDQSDGLEENLNYDENNSEQNTDDESSDNSNSDDLKVVHKSEVRNREIITYN